MCIVAFQGDSAKDRVAEKNVKFVIPQLARIIDSATALLVSDVQRFSMLLVQSSQPF
jgi:hypothetical protein